MKLSRRRRPFDGDAICGNGAGVGQDVVQAHAVKGAILKADAGNDGVGRADDGEHARAVRGGDVLHDDVAHDGRERAGVDPRIDEVNGQHLFPDAADLDVAHEDVLDGAAALGVGFQAQGAVQVRAVHFAILGKNIAHAAGNFAAHHHAAVAVLHHAAAHDDVFAKGH